MALLASVLMIALGAAPAWAQDAEPPNVACSDIPEHQRVPEAVAACEQAMTDASALATEAGATAADVQRELDATAAGVQREMDATAAAAQGMVDGVMGPLEQDLRATARDTMLATPLVVWTSWNMGAGSGLDADSLDGLTSGDFLASVTEEARIRGEADAALRAGLDAESAAREAADAAIRTDLDAETDARKAGDAALASRIASEESARKSADSSLWNSVWNALTGGTTRASFLTTTTNNLYIRGGSAAGNQHDPVIARTDDRGTGIFFPSADEIAFTTNEQERLRIGHDGGIEIQAGGRLVTNRGAGGNNWIESPRVPLPDMKFFTASQERMSIERNSGDVRIKNNLIVGGHIYAHGNHVGDVAEPVVGTDLKPGMLVASDGFTPEGKLKVRLTSGARDADVIGVVSTNPSLVLAGLPTDTPLAVTGIVPVKVMGPVAKSALLTTSATPGHATACVDADACFGAVVGKALEAHEGDGPGVVRVMVSLG